MALVHDSLNFKSFVVDTPLLFSPGFSYEVMIKPTTITRYTEHLGLCLSKLNLKNIGLKAPYSKAPCLSLCLLKNAWNKCGCVLELLIQSLKNVSKLIGIDKNMISSSCNSQKVTCLIKWLNTIRLMFSFAKLCPECKEPCEETVYSFTLTAALLLTANGTFSPDTIKKNYLSIIFYFENMMKMNVVEKQEHTFIDVIILFIILFYYLFYYRSVLGNVVH